MLHGLSRISLAALVCGLMLAPGVSWAQKDRPRKVHDEGKLFSQDAIDRANTVVAQIKEKHRKDFYVETLEKGPAKDQTEWARKRFNEFGVDGVYLVITKDPKHYEIIVGNKTRENGFFTNAHREEMGRMLKETLGKNRDEALMKSVNLVNDAMNEHARTKQAPVNHPERGGAPPWVGWVCMIIGILLVVWVIFALIRAVSGGMGGGYGYGGGGGGFLTGMLGGLFGAMAGMWIYNSFFGGHANYDSGEWGGGDSAGSTPYEADTDGSGGGGDWGGGDDAGGGGDAGGDWGGGGDAGGGDFGGGDFGGGDW